MALDSRQKRAAVIGVGRMWYRNAHPSSLNQEQRVSIGQVYPVAIFSEALDYYIELISFTLYSDLGVDKTLNFDRIVPNDLSIVKKSSRVLYIDPLISNEVEL